MATKAQQYRAEMQRAAQKGTRKGRGAAGGAGTAGSTGAAKKGQGRVKHRIPNQASRNEAPVRARNSSYELEISATSRPSRKQTRKSRNRQKTDSALRITAMTRHARPQARATRPSGNPN